MATSYSDNVDVDYLLEKRETQGRPQVTIDQAQRLSQINQTTSGIPASLMVKATQDNADDGFLDALGTVIAKANNATFGRIKNAVFNQLGVNTETGGLIELGLKGAFLGVRALYEDVIGQPLRAVELESQGVDGKEAWKKAAIDPFAYWKAAKARGEKIDLGNALFQSTDPEKTETYKDLIDKGADPIKAREIAISRLGANIFEEVAEAETKLLFDGDRAAALIARGKSPHITPGRVLFKPLEFIIGPEDRAYDFTTGLFDLGLNLLDPTFIVGKAVKGIKASSKLLTLSDDAADSLGLLNGFMRKSFSRKKAQEVIDGELGNALADFLYKNKNNPATILEESNFRLVNKYVIEDRAVGKEFSNFTKELFELDPNLSVEAGRKAVKDLLTPKILATGTGGVVPEIQKIGTIRKSLQNYFGPLYDTRLNPSNIDNTIVEYSKFLKLLDPSDQLVNRNQRVKELIQGLDELSGTSVNERATFITNKVKDDFSFLRTRYKDELKGKGKLVEGDKTDKLVDNVFLSLTRALDEKNELSKDITRFSKLDKVPLGVKKAWDKLFKDGDDFVEGVNKEVLQDQFDTIFQRPLLETMLTQDLILSKPSEVLKLSNKLIGGFGENFDKASDIVGKVGLGRFFDFYIGQVFKPIVLLRPAWTVRVIAEEQVRAIANGALGVLDHPIGLLAKLFDDNIAVRGSYTKEGWLDTPAFRAGISESTTGDTRTLKAMKRQSVQSNIKYQNIGKKENITKWKEGQYRVVQNYFNSILAKEIASIELSKNKTEAVQQLLTKLKKKGQLRDAMLSLTSGTHNPYRVLRGADGLAPSEYDDVLKSFIKTLRLDMKKSLSYNEKNVSRELYQAIQLGKFKIDNVEYNLNVAAKAGIKQSEFNGLLNGKIKGLEAEKLQKKVDIANKEVLEAYSKKFGGTLPDRVDYKVPPLTDAKGLDRFVEGAFKFFMTTPTNTLSRIPVFKSVYWKKSQELIPISSEKVKQKIITGAKKANLNKSTIKKMEKTASGGASGIDDPQLIENLAKAVGVESVKTLLYDITQTRRFWEASRWLFPFGNAWQEVLTTWLGIFKNQPQVLARGATIWDGAAQDNDTLDPAGKGFFYTNPINNKVMFNYPGSDIFNNWMFKDAQSETDVRVNLPVYAQSVNIAGTMLPGFGPTVQIPAAFLFKNFPEESFITRILFGEFGVPDLKDRSKIGKNLGVVPAWLDKFITLATNQGENSQGAFGNTVIDTYKALLYSGQINDSTEELSKEGMDKAVVAAKRVFLYRAVSQLLGPAGVATPIYELTDKNMDFFAFETLSDEYRTIKAANNFDDVLATQEFINKYGINPLPLTVSKTVSIEPYPTTVEGANWLKQNKELYEKYPLVAMFLEPAPVYAEFSFDAYKKALLIGKREYRKPDQWQVAKNKLLGSVALAEYERSINIIGNNKEEAKALRNAKKKELEQIYWGYGQPGIVGSPNKPTIDMQITQLQKMMLDPSVQKYPSIQAAILYMEQRQKIINGFVNAGLSETVWKTSAKYAGVRAALRNEAYKIIQDIPQFGPLFDTLLSREIEPEYEDNLLVELGLGQ
jgi:uncharacterized protein YpmS